MPCIVAIGGYGRGDLAPFSDIDVVFIAPALAKKWAERIVAACWDKQLKVSCSIRTPEACAEDMARDLDFMTALLERRFVGGSKTLFRKLDKMVRGHIKATPPGSFVAEKLAERNRRHAKAGDSRFILQPNVKEGKGGLRDIHTLLWITNFLYGARKPADLLRKKIMTKAETRSLEKAQAFLTRIRAEMHLVTGRAEDRLTFDIQPDVALRMGYKDAEPNVRAEKFMKDYFLAANETGYLTRVLCADLEARALAGGATSGTKRMAVMEKVGGFPLLHNRLTVPHPKHFRAHPDDIVRIFRVGQLTGYDIHPDALRLLRGQKPQGLKLFFDILQDPKNAASTLRRMNEARVLEGLIPEFGVIFAHMQYDMYHVYTADEHTLHTIENLHKIENGAIAAEAPLATELFQKIHLRRPLYAAMFFHDIAKGTGGQHARKGSVIMRKYGPQMGLAAAETDMAAWLVENHLLMTMTAFKRDLNDPETIAAFANDVQSPERLKLLTVMTTADILGVGPERWNNWKAGLLSELYAKTYALLTGTSLADSEMMQGFSEESIRLTSYPEKGYTKAVIYTPDRQGLFALLSGAMAASGASIVDARIHTLDNGMALDTFYIQDLKGAYYENLPYLRKTLRSALDGRLDIGAEISQKRKSLPRREKLFRVPTHVVIDNSPASATMIEVSARDRPGLLHDITAALAAEGLKISAAKVTTFGAKAMDVFYVRDSFGLKIMHPEKIASIENVVKRAVEHE